MSTQQLRSPEPRQPPGSSPEMFVLIPPVDPTEQTHDSVPAWSEQQNRTRNGQGGRGHGLLHLQSSGLAE